MKIIVEVVFIAVLLFCAWNGYRKGFITGIATLLAVIVSLYTANLISDTFSGEANTVLRPFIQGYMDGSEGAIEKSLAELMDGGSTELSFDDVLKNKPELRYEVCKLSYIKLGVFEKSAERMAKDAVTLADAEEIPIDSAIVDVMCENATFYLGFILFFVLIFIIFIVLGNLINLNFLIPNMEKLNRYGGLATGLITGILFCSLLAWILRLCGLFLPEATLSHTLISRLFIKMDLLSLFI